MRPHWLLMGHPGSLLPPNNRGLISLIMLCDAEKRNVNDVSMVNMGEAPVRTMSCAGDQKNKTRMHTRQLETFLISANYLSSRTLEALKDLCQRTRDQRVRRSRFTPSQKN